MLNFGTLTNVALMLGLTILLIYMLSFFVKKMKYAAPGLSSQVKIICGVSLTGKSKLVLIKAYDSEILLGVTDTNIQTISVFDKNIKTLEEKVSA